MANIKYSELLTHVLPDLLGCSDPLAEQTLRSVVIDFCTRSKLWRFEQDAIDMTASEPEYDLDLPPSSSLVQIMACSVSGTPIRPVGIDQLDRDVPGWRDNYGQPEHFLQYQPESFFLNPIPNSSAKAAIRMSLALKPSRNSNSFPAWIADQYQDALLAGVKARLMLQLNRSWTNPRQAAIETDIYERAIGTAINAGVGSLVRAVQRTASQH